LQLLTLGTVFTHMTQTHISVILCWPKCDGAYVAER